MNRQHSSRPNAANAVVELDCPWCAGPILATAEELEDGLACPACCVLTDFGQPAGVDAWFAAPLAA